MAALPRPLDPDGSWTYEQIKDFNDVETQIYFTYQENLKGELYHLGRYARNLLNVDRRGVSANNLAMGGYEGGDEVVGIIPTRRSDTSRIPSLSPTISLAKGKETVKPTRPIRSLPHVSAVMAEHQSTAFPTTSSHHEIPNKRIKLVSVQQGSLQASPTFLDRLEPGQSTVEVPPGLMPHQVAGYHQYLADLANPNSLACKLKDLRVEDVKPSILAVKALASPARPTLAQPVAMQIDSDDDDEEAVPYIKDVSVAGKSLKASNVRKFSGGSDQDAAVYYERFNLSLDFIFADPSIRLPFFNGPQDLLLQLFKLLRKPAQAREA